MQSSIYAATECNDLIINSQCSEDGSNQCVCEEGLIQYRGAKCQIPLDGKLKNNF